MANTEAVTCLPIACQRRNQVVIVAHAREVSTFVGQAKGALGHVALAALLLLCLSGHARAEQRPHFGTVIEGTLGRTAINPRIQLHTIEHTNVTFRLFLNQDVWLVTLPEPTEPGLGTGYSHLFFDGTNICFFPEEVPLNPQTMGGGAGIQLRPIPFIGRHQHRLLWFAFIWPRDAALTQTNVNVGCPHCRSGRARTLWQTPEVRFYVKRILFLDHGTETISGCDLWRNEYEVDLAGAELGTFHPPYEKGHLDISDCLLALFASRPKPGAQEA